MIPYRFWKRYGDNDVIREHYPMMRRFGQFLIRQAGAARPETEEGNPYAKYVYEKGMHLGEWLEPPEIRDRDIGARDNRPEECTAYLHYTMTCLSELAASLGELEDEKIYSEYAAGARQAYNWLFVHKGTIDTDRQARQGATTVWENWDGEASRNHYTPGSVCDWLFTTVAGISVYGENMLRIAPQPGGTLTEAAATYDSLYGRVSSSWRKTADSYELTVELPPNTYTDIVCLTENVSRSKEFDRALLFCGTGMGIHIAAGKCPGVHCGVVESVPAARRAITSNGVNVLAMGAFYVAPQMGKEIADAFLYNDLGSGYEYWPNFYEFHKLAIDELDAFDYKTFKQNGFEVQRLGDVEIALVDKPEQIIC